MNNDEYHALCEHVKSMPQGSDEDPETENAIREHLRVFAEQGDTRACSQARILLGEYYLGVEKPSRARRQFRLALEDVPTSVNAMLGVAESYLLGSRYTDARSWYESARQAAQDTCNKDAVLRALDQLASIAALQDDSERVTSLLGEMCHILTEMDYLESVYLSSAGALLRQNQGVLCRNYLECLLRRLLRSRQTFGPLSLAAAHLVVAYRQSGVSGEESERLLREFESLAASEASRLSFARACGKARALSVSLGY